MNRIAFTKPVKGLFRYATLTVVGVFATAFALGGALVSPAQAQINVITVDVTPLVSPGGSSFGPQNTMGQALQAVDQGSDFNVTEVTPAVFAAMTAGSLAAFDLIAINNHPGRIAGGIGTTWQQVAGCDNGRTMLNSHDAPRFHMNVPPGGPPLFSGLEPFGAPDLVRQAALWAGGVPGKTGLLIFNDALNFVGGSGWDNAELGPLPAIWGITDSGFNFTGFFPDGGYTLITAVGATNPVYNGALGVPLSGVRGALLSISSFAANIGDGSFHSIFATFNAALFTPTEVVQNAGVVNVGGLGGFGATSLGPDGTAITLICEPRVIRIDIDVKPGSDPSCFNPTKSKGVIPYAILGTAGLDVNDINRSTLEFGPGGATAVHNKGGHIEDAEPKDGIDDLVVHVLIGDTGLVPGDTEACVKGELFDGTPIEGCNDVCVRPKPKKG